MILKSAYPDDSVWRLVHTEFTGGRISKSTGCFAPVFAPPQWPRPVGRAPRVIAAAWRGEIGVYVSAVSPAAWVRHARSGLAPPVFQCRRNLRHRRRHRG